jgi:hypothetical protein
MSQPTNDYSGQPTKKLGKLLEKILLTPLDMNVTKNGSLPDRIIRKAQVLVRE